MEAEKLSELPMSRDIYCSQEMTDRVLGYLWKERPDLVKNQMEMEHSDFDQTYLMELSKFICFLKYWKNGIRMSRSKSDGVVL